MKATIFSGLALAATATATVIPRRGLNESHGITEAYATRMAESWIVNNHEATRDYWYGRSVIYTGYEAVVARTGNDELLDWYRSRIDGLVVTENGTIPGFNESHYSLDDYRIGHNLLYWYERTGEEKYKTAATTIRDMLDRHPRTPTGGFWHRSPTYKNQMWLDGIFMADTFYAYYTHLFQADNTTAWDDIVLQFDKIEAITRDPETNLLYHGYDEGKEAVWADPETGRAPIVWNRAVGWYIWALVELLNFLPESHEGRERILGYYTSLAEGLKDAQDPESHGWWLVMNEPYPGKEGNYFESSSAAMFTYGWLAGLREGWLDEAEYLGPATKAYTHLIEDFVTENKNGTVTWEDTVSVGSLGSNATFEYYVGINVVRHDTRGVGPFLMAAVEWEARNNITS